jgi:glycosyltransferase involved in cell wall biosynthesis
MKIIIAVHDLLLEKSHLMPWRTVCDVVMHLRESFHEVTLLSLGSEKKFLEGTSVPDNTLQIRKNLKYLDKDLQDIISLTKAEIIFWPVSWRESKKRTQILSNLNLPVVAWFPGGVYSFKAVFRAIKVIGLKKSLPYISEILSSKTKQIKHFKKCHFDAILTMTVTTSNSVRQAGWPDEKTYTVMPGKEIDNVIQDTVIQLNPDFLAWLDAEKYYLYMGPPSAIRGIFELLEAFDLAAHLDKNIRLVCLFRSDAKIDQDLIIKFISKLTSKKRIFCVLKSVERDELYSYMANSHAITMPFMLVPSEIPLAIIEAMAFSIPIITTSPGGTGDFVSEFGFSPIVGDISGLADVLYCLANDKKMHDSAILATREAFSRHPTWPEVANQWYAVAEKVINKDKVKLN